MTRTRRAVILWFVFVATIFIAANATLAQQPDPNSPRWKGVVALRELISSRGDQAVVQFIETRLSDTLRDSYGDDELFDALVEIRGELAGARMRGAGPSGPLAAELMFNTSGGEATLAFELDPEAPDRFLRIGPLTPGESADADANRAPHDQSGGFTSLDELGVYLAAEAEAKRFSGVVLVAEQGEVVFYEAYGLASRRYSVPNRPDTKFNLGSINKSFTMMAVYQLIEQGRIDLDDTLGEHLEGFPADVASAVTIEHLLAHRAGWGAYWDNESYNANWRDLRTHDDYLAFLRDVPLEFAPDTRQQYSNSGYVILGCIIESVTGQSYYDYVRANIFEPAGMTDTDSYEMDAPVENLAIGYMGGGYERNNLFHHSVRGTAAGGGYSTAKDMLRYVNAIADGKLIGPKFVRRFRGMGIAGGGPGINAALETDLGDYTVIVMTNFDPPTAGQIAAQIRSMLMSTGMAHGGMSDADLPPYSLGVGLEMTPGHLEISFVAPGSGAEKAGAQAGDVVLSVNGEEPDHGLMDLLDEILQSDDPIELIIQRGGKKQTIMVTPQKR